MKAIVQDEYGSPADVLRVEEIDKPAPKDDEVLLRVHAAGINIGDWHAMRGMPKIMRPALVCNTLVTAIRTIVLACSRPPSTTIIVPSSR